MDAHDKDRALETILLASVKEQRQARRWGIFFKLVFLGYLLAILIPVFVLRDRSTAEIEHVGVVEVFGEITNNGPGSAESIIAALQLAYEGKDIQGIILSINSPGGLPVQSHYVVEEIRRLRAEHPDIPVYAAIADVGASAAYHIASAADEIYADPTSIVGSIGVLSPGFGVVDLIKKIGIESRTMTAGEHKMMLNPLDPVDPVEKAMVQTVIDDAHTHFIADVKAGRGERLLEDSEIFSGRYWTGNQALPLGLIDGFGSAAQVARDKFDSEELVYYSVSRSLLDELSGKLGATLQHSLTSAITTSTQTPAIKY